jgi:hypothetical protein
MLTRPPVNEGTPHGAAVQPSHSIQNNRMALHQLMIAIGALIDVAAFGSGYSGPALLHWAGANLIRWGEQERAAMGERLGAAVDREV